MVTFLSILNHARKHTLLYIAIALLCTTVYHRFKIENLRLHNSLLTNQISTIKSQAADYSEKLKKSKIEYQRALIDSQNNANRILGSAVSDTCQDSIKWAVDQARYF